AVFGTEQTAPELDHAYVQQMGLALINDSSRWPRGAEFLRIAGRGLPLLRSGFFILIAKANERAGNFEASWLNFELCKRAGKAVGPKNLAEQDKHDYFAVVKI